MKNKFIIVITSFILISSMFAFANNSVPNEIKLNVTEKPTGTTTISQKSAQTPPANVTDYIIANSLDIVNNPDFYLNKKVKFKATFEFISFLIKRPDITDHTIPMSEMKIFITRDEAEKFIELDSGDIIEIYGKVFSNALTDAWVDVDKLVIVEKKKN